MELLKEDAIAQVTKSAEPIGSTNLQIFTHSLRTAITAVISMFVARMFRLPQSYWAPITTIVITQSVLGTTLAISWQRLFGTAIGAAVGGVVATYFHSMPAIVFGASIFLLGLVCAVLRADRAAYRLGGVTLGIILLVPGSEPPWRFAFHRFAEVSVGIAVALIMTVVWPERSPAQRNP
jgi:uncharacterized membrane protein YgaE (UPF0421/DUF939 family)